MAGHKISHTQLERYRLIDALLSDGGAVSFAGLLSHLRARLRDDTLSESSVRRDLRYMRDALGAPLCYDSARRLWCYTKPFKFPSESFTDDEALALHLLQKLPQQRNNIFGIIKINRPNGRFFIMNTYRNIFGFTPLKSYL